MPVLASAHVQRWALTLSSYQYTIEYRPGSKIADALSRLPLPTHPSTIPQPQELINLMEIVDQSPLTSNQIKQWTARDPILSRVLEFVQKGWPHEMPPEEFAPYFRRKYEL